MLTKWVFFPKWVFPKWVFFPLNRYDEAKELEANYKAQAVREMIVYGMVYKRGHKRKNWQVGFQPFL